MTRRDRIAAIALGLISALLVSEDSQPVRAQSREKPISTAKTTEGLAISLLNMSDQLAAPDAQRLYGATRLLGFLITDAPSGRDCILITSIEPNRPGLRLQDLAVAYTNIRQGSARPACTIDPRPQTLSKLAEVGRRIISSVESGSVEQDLKSWKKLAESPQDVRVLHVPAGTAFAKTMVDADYALKSICNGVVSLKGTGIISLSDLLLKEVKEEITADQGALKTPLQIYNRFWFNPGVSRYQTDELGLFLLTSCPVVLLTEQEALTENGNRSSLAKANPLAKKFADTLTARFDDLARTRPLYRELENLYRAVAIVDLLYREAEKVGSLEILEESFGRAEVRLQKPTTELAGKSDVKKVHGQIPGGSYTLWLPSCGGVCIDIDMAKAKREKDATGRLSKLARVILKARPKASSVAWKFTL